jgi:uncharacterized protein with PQ loop repeat
MPEYNYKKMTDRLALVVGVLQPLSTLPQIWQIQNSGSVAGVSAMAWFLSATSGLVFLAYGIFHKLRPIVITQILWFILQMIVVIQVMVHG